MEIWLVPLCTLGGAVGGWFTAPLAEDHFERPAPLARPGIAVLTALTFGLLAWRFAGRPELAAYLYLATVGALLAAVDVEVQRLPDSYTLPSYLIGPAFLWLAALTGDRPVRLQHAIIGLAVLWVLYAVQHVFAPRMIGWGDVKLSGVRGVAAGHAAGLAGHRDPVRAVHAGRGPGRRLAELRTDRKIMISSRACGGPRLAQTSHPYANMRPLASSASPCGSRAGQAGAINGRLA